MYLIKENDRAESIKNAGEEKERIDMIKFNHFNFNVFDLEKSLKFYEDALGLKVVREKKAEDDSFILVYLGDGLTEFTLELTYMRERKEPYNLGDLEYHLAFVTDDYEGLHKRHEEMGVIVFENKEMGIYFISDPDGYWIEIVPDK
jgi:lactoylglutathione lyase